MRGLTIVVLVALSLVGCARPSNTGDRTPATKAATPATSACAASGHPWSSFDPEQGKLDELAGKLRPWAEQTDEFAGFVVDSEHGCLKVYLKPSTSFDQTVHAKLPEDAPVDLIDAS